MKNYFSIVLLSISLVLLFVSITLYSKFNKKSKTSTNKPVLIQYPFPTKSPLSIEQIKEMNKNNPRVMEILNSDSIIVLNSQEFDITGDKKKELVLNTSGEGCASCHGRTIYIFDGNTLIFKESGSDIWTDEAPNMNGFRLHEPLFHSSDGACCPSEAIVYTYKYAPNKDRTNASTNINNQYFYVWDERSEKYN